MSIYEVGRLNTDNICVHVPGSKSITNRALLLAALSEGTSHIEGILESDDSKHFIESLKLLGYQVFSGDSHVIIKGCGRNIPNKTGSIYVGSAGTAARFLTAMLAFSDGTYYIDSSEQMKKRPMKELISALMCAGAKFEFQENEYSFPFKVTGAGNSFTDKSMLTLDVNIDKSSQFLSALLMAAPLSGRRVHIHLTGERKAKSYVKITQKMMHDFGVDVLMLSDNDYVVDGTKSCYNAGSYMCEPDVSAACYFYAMAAVTGKSALVYNVHRDSMQGDIKFVELLERIGCTAIDTDEGIILSGPDRLYGIKADMSDYSDQALTLAAIAPFTDSGVVINGIAHIRGQETDRIKAMYNELTRMQIECVEQEDGIAILPGKPQPALVETYNDHRVAMSFAVTGLCMDGLKINNPECSHKTFPEYFNILDDLCKQEESI